MRSRGRRRPVQVPITLPEVLQPDRRDVAIGHTYNNRARQSLARIEGFRCIGRIASAVPRNGAARHPIIPIYAVVEIFGRRTGLHRPKVHPHGVQENGRLGGLLNQGLFAHHEFWMG